LPTSNRVYVYLQLPGSLEIVTAGYFEQTERTGVRVGVFVYNPAYLEREDAVPLDPFELPLRPGRFETVKRRNPAALFKEPEGELEGAQRAQHRAIRARATT